MNTRLNDTLRAAQAEGLLPEQAQLPHLEERPWPVVLLTALGAWMAAIPLLIAIGMVLGPLLEEGASLCVVGALLLAAATVLLRSPQTGVFLEQLAVPAFLAGACSLGWGLSHIFPDQMAAATLMCIALALAVAIAKPWLRILLGFAAANLLGVALASSWHGLMDRHAATLAWAILHVSFAIWLAAWSVQRSAQVSPRLLGAMESTGAGWLLAVLAGLAWVSGQSFLLGGAMGGSAVGDVVTEIGNTGLVSASSPMVWAMRLLSAAVALAAVGWLGRAWPTLRSPSGLLAGAVLAALSFFIPQLGATLLALALMLTSRRWRLAGAAGLAALWMLGSYYYVLAWPLAQKAVVLVLAGAVLGALAWWVLRGPAQQASSMTAHAGRSWALVLASVLATLGIANYSIQDKEQLIANGQPLFVELAPVDPRSLMQGDYMRLRFKMPADEGRDAGRLLRAERLYAVAQRDARGVAQLLRIRQANEPLAAGEFLLQLTPKNGDWVLVTDAWFFREGDGERWAQARFGEFRVLPDGRALLVGMADAQLRPIPP